MFSTFLCLGRQRKRPVAMAISNGKWQKEDFKEIAIKTIRRMPTIGDGQQAADVVAGMNKITSGWYSVAS